VADLPKSRFLACLDVFLEEERDFLVKEDGGADRIHGAKGNPVVPAPEIS